jgi:hypothetical protein
MSSRTSDIFQRVFEKSMISSTVSRSFLDTFISMATTFFNLSSPYYLYDGTFLPVCGFVEEDSVSPSIVAEVLPMLRRGPMSSGKKIHSVA